MLGMRLGTRNSCQRRFIVPTRYTHPILYGSILRAAEEVRAGRLRKNTKICTVVTRCYIITTVRI